jgi:hypothetical protein
MPGSHARFCASVPKAMITGATMPGPMGARGGASAAASSLAKR